jgi:hypothetical protein
VWLAVGCAAAAACAILAVRQPQRPVPPQGPLAFSDMLEETGIGFVHTDGSSGQRYIVETVCCGLATFDYNGDGLIDIYFVNGAPLRGRHFPRPPTNALYRNEGGWRFTDVTREAGVGDTGYGLGVAVGDYDNDGDPDLYVSNFGPKVLYRNNGDGTFTDVTLGTGVADGEKVGAGACFLDADADGALDLFVANYVDFTFENHVACSVDGVPSYAGPRDYRGAPDSLFHNQGDGTFVDVSTSSGIAAVEGTGMGTVACDYDDDGDTDVFVCNDVDRNYLFRNNGCGQFDEVGLAAGIAYNYFGTPTGSMGVDCGDYDNDGRLDFYVTDFQGESPVLYRNLGEGFFDDVSRQTGAGQGCYNHVNWGLGWADFDNDGDRDLFVANGHINDNIELRDDTTAYHARNVLLMNDGNGSFADVSAAAGDGLEIKLSSRGAALDDLDNDGDVDIVVLNSRREPSILRNDSPHAGRHWLQVELRGTRSNRDGVGARVAVYCDDSTLVDEVHSGRGYQSHFGSRLHFGLGAAEKIDSLEVRWPSGGRETFHDLEINRLNTLVEGTGEPTPREPGGEGKVQ